ncbi:hypothetical protein [Jannaschia sp. 2305UL9-9]|uniref:hypothetical protein n=1 Tax=Jannaschia sp. 2305UL9-9 TaxID=3121638 RepID=UPI003529D3F1
MPVVLGLLCSGTAMADSGWALFEARCLVPYEHIAPADVRGLVRTDGGWARGGEVVLITTPSSCTARGATADLATRLAARQAYVEISAGVWQSHLWREPRMEVVLDDSGLTARETDLES